MASDKNTTHLAREDCEICYDLTSEPAEISISSIGPPSGWNIVLIRTQKGKELFDALIKEDSIQAKKLIEVKPGFPLLEKVVNSKKKKSNKHIENKKSNSMKIPLY